MPRSAISRCPRQPEPDWRQSRQRRPALRGARRADRRAELLEPGRQPAELLGAGRLRLGRAELGLRQRGPAARQQSGHRQLQLQPERRDHLRRPRPGGGGWQHRQHLRQPAGRARHRARRSRHDGRFDDAGAKPQQHLGQHRRRQRHQAERVGRDHQQPAAAGSGPRELRQAGAVRRLHDGGRLQGELLRGLCRSAVGQLVGHQRGQQARHQCRLADQYRQPDRGRQRGLDRRVGAGRQRGADAQCLLALALGPGNGHVQQGQAPRYLGLRHARAVPGAVWQRLYEHRRADRSADAGRQHRCDHPGAQPVDRLEWADPERRQRDRHLGVAERAEADQRHYATERVHAVGERAATRDHAEPVHAAGAEPVDSAHGRHRHLADAGARQGRLCRRFARQLGDRFARCAGPARQPAGEPEIRAGGVLLQPAGGEPAAAAGGPAADRQGQLRRRAQLRQHQRRVGGRAGEGLPVPERDRLREAERPAARAGADAVAGRPVGSADAVVRRANLSRPRLHGDGNGPMPDDHGADASGLPAEGCRRDVGGRQYRRQGRDAELQPGRPRQCAEHRQHHRLGHALRRYADADEPGQPGQRRRDLAKGGRRLCEDHRHDGAAGRLHERRQHGSERRGAEPDRRRAEAAQSGRHGGCGGHAGAAGFVAAATGRQLHAADADRSAAYRLREGRRSVRDGPARHAGDGRGGFDRDVWRGFDGDRIPRHDGQHVRGGWLRERRPGQCGVVFGYRRDCVECCRATGRHRQAEPG
ncbi:hypothetical protein BUGL105410_08490 [Burkholderia gladioli]